MPCHHLGYGVEPMTGKPQHHGAGGRVLAVDDFIVGRAAVRAMLVAMPDVAVIETARSASVATGILEGFAAMWPIDIVLLDVELPSMTGIEALPHLRRVSPSTRIFMASSLTRRGAAVTVTALAAGASDYVCKLQAAEAAARQDFATTKETSFFRDGRPFDQLTGLVLPELVEARAGERRLRIWSAAASTGQEAYSIAKCLDELAPRLSGWRFSILGTDIAESAISRAQEGRYCAFEVQRGLIEAQLARHFTRAGDDWKIRERLARMVEFRWLNRLAGGRLRTPR